MQFLLHAHSGWRYIVIFACALALINLLIGLAASKPWTKKDKLVTLLFVLAVDIQLLMGVVLWIWQQAIGIGQRATWDHPITMILVFVMAHSAIKNAKRAETDKEKFKAAFFRLLIATLLMGFGIWRITTAVPQ